MGEARRKRTLLDQLLAEQPYCIYCGGRTLGDSVDHMPPRTIFDLRYRPKGLEFLACTACNAGGKKAEQIAGFLSRLLYPTPRTREIDQELRKIFKQMINNHRDVLLEMFPTDEQLATFRHSYPTLQQFKPLSVKGPLITAAMLTFAAKMGLALHYRENHRVVPWTGPWTRSSGRIRLRSAPTSTPAVEKSLQTSGRSRFPRSGFVLRSAFVGSGTTLRLEGPPLVVLVPMASGRAGSALL
jgi:hypothetical protein